MKAASIFPNRTMPGILGICLLLLSLAGNAIAEDQGKDQEEAQPQSGRAYVMSNLAEGNTVIVYNRAADGSLTRIQEAATGGFGSGAGILPPPLPPFAGPIPLDSQDAMIVTQDGRFVIAVNPDSNDISVLAITRSGVRLVDRVNSDGSFPVSVTEHNGLVYVANAGQTPDEFIGARPTISGFRLDRQGRLHPIEHSRRFAGGPDASAADLVFSPDGRHLVMTELNGNNVDAFSIDSDGRASERVTQPANSRTPFGAEFSRDGTLTISETNDTSRRFAINNGASLSTYRFTADGTLQPISKAVPNGQTAACWNRRSPDGSIAFTINAGSGTISTYRIADSGEATLLTAVVADTGGAFSLPIDSDVSPDGKFLYVLAALDGLHGVPRLPLPLLVATIQIYSIGTNGALTRTGTIEGIPFTVEGIVVR